VCRVHDYEYVRRVMGAVQSVAAVTPDPGAEGGLRVLDGDTAVSA
jgi:hypothetical protein